MKHINRRNFGIGLLATTGLAACGNGLGGKRSLTIDARADLTVREMLTKYPGTQSLLNNAAGMLVMPLMTEVGFGFGGGWGNGVLRIGNVNADYYSAKFASAGLQIGAQQYSHVLFFMTQDALNDFRTSNGWAANANIKYALSNKGETFKVDTTTALSPVVAVVFAQAGLQLGATLEGVKYTRIIP